ncbi:hypothetical protein BC332_15774 [Capsicum chinense]|nr:hypothetical protein BC332_15774 [Capsicum chinense]
MNTGRRNLSKEMIQMLIALPPKSWSKPSALIVILENSFGQHLNLPEDNNARFQMKMVDVTATVEEHNVTVDNPSTYSTDEEKVEPQQEVSRNEKWLINIIKGFSILAGLPWDCGPFIAAYAKYLSDGLQVPNDGLDAGLLYKRYAALLWKYEETKVQKPYATDIKDPR